MLSGVHGDQPDPPRLLDFSELEPLLRSVGNLEQRESLDTFETAVIEIEMVGPTYRIASWAGLVVPDPSLSFGRRPQLTRAGRQYLAAEGRVALGVLGFLARFVEDLNSREALIHAGGILVDEFRFAFLADEALPHAQRLTPPAFRWAVDRRFAIDLFGAAAALVARLSDGEPAACVAEEILAVRLLELARDWLAGRGEHGELDEIELPMAIAKLGGLFTLFGDESVLALFEMREPADGVLATSSGAAAGRRVLDHRVERWFSPYEGVVMSGHLRREELDD